MPGQLSLARLTILQTAMRVYVVVKDVRYNGESDFDIEVFANEVEAGVFLLQATAVYKRDANLDDWKIEEDSSSCFSAYEEGYECENHYFFKIYEKEI